MGEIITVLSGKGGTGKTSVCAGVSTALAAAGKSVLCIDCDIGLRNLDISLGISDNSSLSFLDICNGSYPITQATQHPDFPTLRFLTAPMNLGAKTVDLDTFGRMLDSAKKQFDYVFLDAPAGIGSGFKLVSTFADRFLLVTGPSPAAVRDAARTGELLELMGKSDVRLIVNRVGKKMFSALSITVDDVMDTAGLPLLGIVPEDKNVVLAAAFTTPLLKYSKRCSAASACKRIAKRIQGIPEPINLR